MRTFERILVIIMVLIAVVVGLVGSMSEPPRTTSPSVESSKPKVTLEEFVNLDVHCDKPHDVLSKYGLAAAKLCNFSKNTGLTPGQIVAMELALYKGGIGGVSPYTQNLIDHDPTIRAFLRSTK
jgi:hypothetical protein